MAACRTEPASGALGVIVQGLDLRVSPADEVWDELRRLLRRHFLLVVRAPDLTDDEHLAFAARFGRVASEGIPHARSVMFVSNRRPDGLLGSEPASFHIDYGFFPHPYEYLSLYGLEIPPCGTATSYVNAVLAASTLPASLRARLTGLQARQVLDLGSADGQATVRVRTGRVDEPAAHMLRPVLWPHRATGEEILGVWEQQTDAIVPLAPDDSAALIEELYAHLYRPEHTYVHQWARGDLVLWDNHALQHGRSGIGQDAPRTLRRVCIGSDQDLSMFARAKQRGTSGAM